MVVMVAWCWAPLLTNAVVSTHSPFTTDQTMVDIEEEPLLPLVRHRKVRGGDDVGVKIGGGKYERKDKGKNKEKTEPELPYGGKVYLKRESKPDHYYVIILEVE